MKTQKQIESKIKMLRGFVNDVIRSDTRQVTIDVSDFWRMLDVMRYRELEWVLDLGDGAPSADGVITKLGVKMQVD